MTTDTKLQELIINKLTTSQYDSIEEKDPNQIYIVTDAPSFDNAITNCLTHIPQDINLELVDGTLTAKQGSRVWIPYDTTEVYQVGDIDSYGNTVVATSWYGSKFFYAIELQSDLTYSDPYNGNWIIVYCATDNTIKLAEDGGSGTTTPSGNGYYYNTSTNKIDYYRQTLATGWVCSFPLIKVTSTSTQITSIDQIFNGFGYIGSTIFALPGVRGKIPNGRNADVSYKSKELVIDKVIVSPNWNDGQDRSLFLFLSSDNTLRRTYTNNYFVQKNTPSVSTVLANWYNPEENIMYAYEQSTNKWNRAEFICVGNYSITTNSNVSNFNPKTTFQAVDRNDSSWLSGLGAPSNRYINLTLLASGSTYTAPANGWYLLSKTGTAEKQFIRFYASKLRAIYGNTTASSFAEGFIYVSKGDSVNITYNAGGATNVFRFYYSEGEIK